MSSADSFPTPRRRRSDGERSRSAILDEAAKLATIEGIDGLSISRLADAVGMSKSGLFAHFGSKEELQLATIDAASAVFTTQVTEPAALAPTGLERLRAMVEGFLHYREVDTFPGEWVGLLVAAVRDAQAEGAIDAGEDPEQLTFEIQAALWLANARYVVARDPDPIERARRAIERRLTASAP